MCIKEILEQANGKSTYIFDNNNRRMYRVNTKVHAIDEYLMGREVNYFLKRINY